MERRWKVVRQSIDGNTWYGILTADGTEVICPVSEEIKERNAYTMAAAPRMERAIEMILEGTLNIAQGGKISITATTEDVRELMNALDMARRGAM